MANDRASERGQERGRSGEARDPNRPTYTDPETGEVEKEGLGPRGGQSDETEGEGTDGDGEAEV